MHFAVNKKFFFDFWFEKFSGEFFYRFLANCSNEKNNAGLCVSQKVFFIFFLKKLFKFGNFSEFLLVLALKLGKNMKNDHIWTISSGNISEKKKLATKLLHDVLLTVLMHFLTVWWNLDSN